MFDVISMASTRSNPFLDLDHVQLLESSWFHLEDIMGCENWVMVLIYQISELSLWKRDCETNRTLSILQLVKRSAQIEEHLQMKLTENTVQKEEARLSLSFSQSASAAITEIFALSALTYLHVTVSGGNSNVPEIADSVAKTIVALKALTDSKLLRCVVWPFCITGCLAQEEQQTTFRSLAAASGFNKAGVGTFNIAFKIMKECWKRREHGLGDYDWVSAMGALGCSVLLG